MKKTAHRSPTELRTQLHNGVCQTLTAVHLHASIMSKNLRRICPEAATDFEEIERLIEQARIELYQVVKQEA